MPGDVVDTHEQLVDEIIRQIVLGFIMKLNHKNGRTEYFSYQDQNNCAFTSLKLKILSKSAF